MKDIITTINHALVKAQFENDINRIKRNQKGYKDKYLTPKQVQETLILTENKLDEIARLNISEVCYPLAKYDEYSLGYVLIDFFVETGGTNPPFHYKLISLIQKPYSTYSALLPVGVFEEKLKALQSSDKKADFTDLFATLDKKYIDEFISLYKDYQKQVY